MLRGPGRTAVSVVSRISALGIAIDTGAPDEVITALGVALDEQPRPHRPPKKTRLLAVTHANRLWYICQYLNFGDGLVNSSVMSLEPLPLYQDRISA